MTDYPSQFETAAGLAAEIAACRICVSGRGTPHLPHAPRPVLRLSQTARLLIAGQAPGVRVHASGMPFDDPSGDRLRDWLGIGRETFYNPQKVAILPMGFCFPGLDSKGSDLPPRKECRTQWHNRAMAVMPQVELLVLLGAYAQDYHLPRLGLAALRGRDLTRTVENWQAFAAHRHPQVFVLPHPSWRNSGWLKANRWFEEQVLPALRAAVSAAVV